jgi:malate dehydrogenase (oxaloacetate-decarboxylating)
VKLIHPTILIGCSTVPHTFTEEVVTEMASHVSRPIIFPLSNPTRLQEASPADLIKWTDGRALVATGSPSPPIHHNGKVYIIGECNNALAFPGLGLGCVLGRAKLLTDKMIFAGARGLAELSPALKDPELPILPDVEDVREISVNVALRVIQSAKEEGMTRAKGIPDDETKLRWWIEEQMWRPEYRELEYVHETLASKHAKGETGIKRRV